MSCDGAQISEPMMDHRAQTAVLFELNAALDQDKLGADFKKNRRLRIPDFLKPAGALALYKHLAQEVQWRAFLASNGKLLTAPSGFRGAYPPELEKKMFERAYDGAQHGFSYLYEANRLFPEDVPNGAELDDSIDGSLLVRFSDFLNSPPVLNFARIVTGNQHIQRTDIQTTRHRRGHFSTFQTLPPAKSAFENTVAAFVITLTLEWAAEWGGLLEFYEDTAYVVEAYVPSFNVIDIFSLPQGHWISAVAPFAAGDRLAISGRLYAP